MTDETNSPAPLAYSGPIVARAGNYYRNARYLIALGAILGGAWFLYDGYVAYPKENQAAIARGSKPPHAVSDLRLQRILGYALPPVGVFLLGWALYRSRGEYRLDNQTLYVPGHPPVPLDSVRRVDKSLWERKGIARIGYELADGTRGELTLDDFIYARQPTDQIYERIDAYVTALAGETPVQESSLPSDEAK